MTQEVVTKIRLDTSSIPGAAAQAGRAIGSIGSTAQVSARQTANAMRQLPMQFTDIATQIAGGQNIGLILLQQGGQIRDAFGSIGGALRGISSLITPARVALGGAAAVIGTVALAAFEGARESAALRDTLILTGNAAGLTETRLSRLANTISESSGQTVGQVRELITTLAASGRVSGQVLESTAQAVARVAELSGRNAVDIAAQFTGLLKDPARVAAQLNEQYNFLNEAQARRIRQLADEGRKVEAANLVNQTLTSALEGQRRELGYIEAAWDGAGKAVSRFWEGLKAIGRPDTAQQALEASRQQLTTLQQRLGREPERNAFGAINPGRAALQQAIAREELRLAGLAERIRQENAQADSRAAAAASSGSVNSILTDRSNADAERNRRLNEQARRAAAAEAVMQRAFAANERDIERGYEQGLGDSQAEFLASALGPVERNTEQQKFLDELLLSNRRANIDLISDDRERARATIDLERELMQQRIEAVYQFGEDRTQAEAAADQARDLALKQLADRRIQSLEDIVGSTLTAGLEGRFEDIGQMFERLLVQMAAKAAAADLIHLLFGRGTGGNLAGLFGGVLDFFGGGTGRAGGGQVNPRSAYLVGEQGPEVLLMGGRGGSIIPNAQLSRGAAGGLQVSIVQHIDSRSDAAQLAQTQAIAIRTAQEGMWQQLRARGLA